MNIATKHQDTEAEILDIDTPILSKNDALNQTTILKIIHSNDLKPKLTRHENSNVDKLSQATNSSSNGSFIVENTLDNTTKCEHKVIESFDIDGSKQ